MLKFIEKHFGLVISSGIIVGLALGDVMYFHPMFLTILLIFMMLISVLKTDLSSLMQHLKNPFWITFLSIAKLIILPVFVFIIVKYTFPEYQTAFVLLACAPAAVAGPGIISILKGDINIGLLVTVITNILVPITIPFVLFYTIGAEVDFELYSMVRFLIFVIIIPFGIAFSMQKFSPKAVKKFNKKSGGIMGIIVFMFMVSVMGEYREVILENINESFFSLFLIIILALFFHLFGVLCAITAKKEIIITSIVSMAYTNAGIIIVLAVQYFSPETALLTVFYEIPWAFGIIPMQLIFAKKHRQRYNCFL